MQRSIPHITKDKENEFAEVFNQSFGGYGFLLFINIINLNIIAFSYEEVRVELLLKNFLTNLKIIFNKDKSIELSRSSYLILLKKTSIEEVIALSSELNKYVNLIDSSDIELSLNCRVISIEYPKYSLDSRILLEKLLLTHSYNDNNYFTNYNGEMNHRLDSREDIRKLYLLKKAILEKTFIFAYQPIVSCRSGNVEYFECLMRIPDETGEFISAGEAIKIAEKTGLINIVDQLVVKMAVLELEKSNISLSVNISNIGIIDPELIQLIQKLLYNKDIAGRLIIEITETSLNINFKKITQFIDLIHELGCKIALDDFGSGYTSFAQLFRLPIDIIKIDRSYIKDLEKYKSNQTMIEGLVKISNAIGAKIVGEFVENKEVAELLMKLNFDSLQGNYFCPPLLRLKN